MQRSSCLIMGGLAGLILSVGVPCGYSCRNTNGHVSDILGFVGGVVAGPAIISLIEGYCRRREEEEYGERRS